MEDSRARAVAENLPAAPVSMVLLGVAAFIVVTDARVVTPILHLMASEFGANVGDTGSIVTAYAIPYGLFQLVYGPFGDRVGKLRVMTVSMALFAVGTAACAAAPSLAALNLLRFLTGVAAAAVIPLTLSYIGDTFPYSQRQAAIGRFLVAISLGNVSSTSLGGLFADVLSWREIFLCFGVAAVGVAVLLARASTARPHPVRQEGRAVATALAAYRRILSQPETRLVMAVVFVEGVFFFGAFAFLGAFLRETFALPYLVIGLILSGFGLGNLAYSRSAGWWVRRFGEQRLILAGGFVDGLCYLAFALLLGWQPLVPVTIVMGVGFYLMHSTLQTKATELAPDARGTAVSLFAFSLFLGQGIGAALLGSIVDSAGYRPAFVLTAAALTLLGIAFVLVSSRTAPKTAS